MNTHEIPLRPPLNKEAMVSGVEGDTERRGLGSGHLRCAVTPAAALHQATTRQRITKDGMGRPLLACRCGVGSWALGCYVHGNARTRDLHAWSIIDYCAGLGLII